MKVRIQTVATSSDTKFDRRLAPKGSYVATLNDNKKWELAKVVKNTTSVIVVVTEEDEYEVKTASATKWLRNLRTTSVTDKTDKDVIKKYWKGEHGLRSLYSAFKEKKVGKVAAEKVKVSPESKRTRPIRVKTIEAPTTNIEEDEEDTDPIGFEVGDRVGFENGYMGFGVVKRVKNSPRSPGQDLEVEVYDSKTRSRNSIHLHSSQCWRTSA